MVVDRVGRGVGHALHRRPGVGGSRRRGEGKAAGRARRTAAQTGGGQRLTVGDRTGCRPNRHARSCLVHRHAHGAAGAVVVDRVGRRIGHALHGRPSVGGGRRRGEGEAAGRGSRTAAQTGRGQGLAVGDRTGHRPSCHHRVGRRVGGNDLIRRQALVARRVISYHCQVIAHFGHHAGHGDVGHVAHIQEVRACAAVESPTKEIAGRSGVRTRIPCQGDHAEAGGICGGAPGNREKLGARLNLSTG